MDRHGTDSYKWDSISTAGAELLPLWLADMDFPAPSAVARAMVERANHPVFGYTFAADRYHATVRDWFHRRHGWRINAEQMLAAPGVMPAVRAAILAFTEPGDQVVVQTPVYHPFFAAITQNERQILSNPLVRHGGRYRMDLEHLRATISSRTRLMILCSPHNPVGRVWSRKELAELGGLCREHRIVVIADEIHADILMPGNRFVPFADVAPEICVSTISPSKTFNIAGLSSGHVVIPDDRLREAMHATMQRLGHGVPNLMSLVAAEAAYANGDSWLDSVLEYIHANDAFLREALAEALPDVSVTPLEGTYIAWLDFRDLMARLSLDSHALKHRLWSRAKVGLSDGPAFGDGGAGFQRLILATSRTLLGQAIDRLSQEFAG
jgi:cysteine-S-conjugate beta-lyase